LRELGNASDLAKADVQRIVIAHCEQNGGTLVIAEQSDNIGGGAPGDGTGLLNWFLEWNVPDALLAINDPATVQAAEALGAGQTGSFCVGGKECDLGGAPVCGDFEVLRTGDGLFVLEDPNSHLASMCGNRFDMGRCAVLKRAGTTILVTSRKTPPFDLGQWRSQGIEPGDFRVIGVKAAVAHQRAYTPIAKALIWADTPGPCSGNVATLPYRLVERPIYPLDKTANFFVP
jgi:microcystin degradation protein MlrC